MTKKERILICGGVVAFVGLLAAMVCTVILNSTASGTLYADPPFALSSLISNVEMDNDEVAMGEVVLPSLIGVGNEWGITVGENVVRELYTMLTPCIANGFADTPDRMTNDDWLLCAENTNAVYLRYPNALPIAILQTVAACASGTTVEVAETVDVQLVRELFVLLPDGEDCQLMVMDLGGNVWRYRCSGRGEYPTMAQVRDFTEGLSTNFYRYRLLTQTNGTLEPVFIERMRVRNVLMTPGTAVMMQENRQEDRKALLSRFGFNPEKLSAHEEADGTQVIVESHGVFQLQNDRMTYTAAAEGGLSLQQFVGYKESYTLTDSLCAACVIIEAIRDIHPYYLGGDASPMLAEVSMVEDRLRLVFRYAFDNVPLDGCGAAVVVEIENDRVMLTDMYAIALRSLGDFDSSYLEYGLFDWTTPYYDVTLTYPANFGTGSVFPTWTIYCP